MLKLIFSVLTIAFGAAGMMELIPYEISLPVMFFFLGSAMIANAKENYDKGNKRSALFFCGIAVFVYAVTVYNVLSRVI